LSSSDTESVEVAVPESKRLKVSNLREKVEVPLNSSTEAGDSEEDPEFSEWLRAVEGPRPTRK
jgi:hypothetical protein